MTRPTVSRSSSFNFATDRRALLISLRNALESASSFSVRPL
nr:MAG TPA: hypothetical protein [Caudoviricetes sp.]